MKLRLTPRAVENIIEIADYIRERNPAAAQSVRATIYDSLRTLLLFPMAGRRQTTLGVRKLVTLKYGYLIYYTVDTTTDELIVLSIKHGAREREHSDL
jgi:plasmid stabilization system protein ParE